MLQRSSARLAHALLSSLIAIAVSACGGGSTGGSGSATTSGSTSSVTATSSSSSSTTAAASSAASSTTSSAVSSVASSASSATASTLFSENFDNATESTLFSSYRMLSTNASVPMFANKSGAITLSAGVVSLDGARMTIGALASTDTTSSSTPGGELNLSGSYSIVIDLGTVSGTSTKAFQVYVDNNTTSSSSSPLGSASKIYSAAISTLTSNSTITIPGSIGSSSSFIALRTESGAVVGINAIRIVSGSTSSSSSAASSSAASSAASSSATSSSATSSASASAGSGSIAVATVQSNMNGGFASPAAGGLPVFNAAGQIVGSTLSNARIKYAASLNDMNTIVQAGFYNDAGKKVSGGAYPLLIVYSGNEDALIAKIVADSTIDANHNCPAGHWADDYREVPLKDYTAGITIIGTDGSSANFGITVVNSGNVIIRNMKIGALGGANNDADMIRIDNSSNVWVDHNELFAVNNECNGSPDGDLTFESAIDIKKNAQNITVSYNYIHDSKKVGLDGHTQSGGTSDYQRTVTYHHNYYHNVNARLPLQRWGWIHVYNNLYDGITSSGINVRASGQALIESNWFQNALNPITCRYDTTGCGTWELRNNNLTSSADNATYNITWDDPGTGGINATDWTTTGTFTGTLSYTYTPATASCVGANLKKVAGAGKGLAALSCS